MVDYWLIRCEAKIQIPTQMHTNITGHYNPSNKIIDLVSHTTNVVCVNFTHKCRNLQFKVGFERQIFLKTFHGNFKECAQKKWSYF